MSDICYKMQEGGPFQDPPPWIQWDFAKHTRYVSREEFLKEDELIPILACNEQIFPSAYRSLVPLLNRMVAFVAIARLSGSERGTRHVFVDLEFVEKALRHESNFYRLWNTL